MARVVYLQTVGRQMTLERAERQQHQKEAIVARRGCIYDSTGMLMAGTIQTRTLFLDPKFMQDCYQVDGHSLVEMDDAIGKLAKIIDKTMGFRVSAEDEMTGVDLTQHAETAYDFGSIHLGHTPGHAVTGADQELADQSAESVTGAR